MGQSSATPSRDLSRKSEGWKRGKWEPQCIVLPPTALYIRGAMGVFPVVGRIVFGQAPDVGVGVEIGLPMQRRGGVAHGQVAARHPTALLQAHDLDSGLGEAPGEGGARSASADYENVGNVVRRT